MKYIFILLITISVTAWLLGPWLYVQLFTPTTSSIAEQSLPVSVSEITELATNLSVPWDVARLPNGNVLVTERTGDIVLV